MKVLHGKKLEALVNTFASVGLHFEQEAEANFETFSQMVSSLKAENESLKAAAKTVDDAVLEVAQEKDGKILALTEELNTVKATAEKNISQALAEDRETPSINKLESDQGPSAKEVWASMPATTLEERKAKQEYFTQHVRGK